MRPHTLVLIILLLPTPAVAVSQEPLELIRSTTELVLNRLAQAPEIKAQPDRLKTLVEESIVPSIDFVRLSRLTLGKHWRTATPEQRNRFTREFKQLLIRTYSTSLTAYSGQEIEYIPLKETADGKRSAVRTKLHQPDGLPLTVDYRLYKAPQGWKIYDVSIEGVSLAVNYRSSFGQEIRTQGLDELIRHIASRNQ